MIVLWLLVAHLVGDYVLQSRWEAIEKFGWTRLAMRRRTAHVATYLLPFLPVAYAYEPTAWKGEAFLAGLVVLHWLTDAQRFTSTLGDVVGWNFLSPNQREAETVTTSVIAGVPVMVSHRDVAERRIPPPNPWPSIPLALDQTAHLIQIAVLAEVFLR